MPLYGIPRIEFYLEREKRVEIGRLEKRSHFPLRCNSATLAEEKMASQQRKGDLYDPTQNTVRSKKKQL